MKKNPYDDHEVIDEINVVPLLDLAWNLLLVFMIVVTAAVQGINVNLPKASAGGKHGETHHQGHHDNGRRDHLPGHFPGHHDRTGNPVAAVQGRRPESAGGGTGRREDFLQERHRSAWTSSSGWKSPNWDWSLRSWSNRHPCGFENGCAIGRKQGGRPPGSYHPVGAVNLVDGGDRRCRRIKRNRPPKAAWIAGGLVAVLLLGACLFVVNLMMSDEGPKRKNQVSTVNPAQTASAAGCQGEAPRSRNPRSKRSRK